MQFDKSGEVPVRLLLGEPPAHSDLSEVVEAVRLIAADDFLDARAPVLPGSAREALLKLYKVDEAARESGATEINVQLEILTGKPDVISWRIPSITETISLLAERNPDMLLLTPGEQALYAFKKCGYMNVGLSCALAILKAGSMDDRERFLPDLIEHGMSAMWVSAINAFPEKRFQQALAAQISSSFDCRKAVEVLNHNGDPVVQDLLAGLLLDEGDGFQLLALVKATSPRFDEAVIAGMIERYGKAEDTEFTKLGLKLVATELSAPAQMTLLAFFLEEEDPDFAQIALKCLAPDESQIPFGQVLLAAQKPQYIEYALRLEDGLYPPLRAALASL